MTSSPMHGGLLWHPKVKTREDLDTQGNRRVTDDPGWEQGAAGGALVTHQTALAVVRDWGLCWEGPWGPASGTDTLIRCLHLQSAASRKRSLDLNSGFFVEEQVSSKNNAGG